jgi:DNA invertase Pin-like site-specific DNA recombinase
VSICEIPREPRALAPATPFDSLLARLVERTKAGMESARRRGAKIGRPRRRFDVERARELRGAGMSLRAVAAELGVPQATLYRALSLANGSAP